MSEPDKRFVEWLKAQGVKVPDGAVESFLYDDNLEWLKKYGYRVRFRYWRYHTVYLIDPAQSVNTDKEFSSNKMYRYYRRSNSCFQPYPKGGLTECEVQQQDAVSQEWETVIVGESRCMTCDNFQYSIARSLSLQDAIDKMSARDKFEYLDLIINTDYIASKHGHACQALER